MLFTVASRPPCALLVQKPIFFEVYTTPLTACCCVTFWSPSHSVKTLWVRNSYLHLHSSNFQQLQCPGIGTDLTDINTSFCSLTWQILVFFTSSDALYHFFQPPIFIITTWNCIKTIKSQKPDSLLWSPPPGLPAHLFRCVL